jgi:hypothetical protein
MESSLARNRRRRESRDRIADSFVASRLSGKPEERGESAAHQKKRKHDPGSF